MPQAITIACPKEVRIDDLRQMLAEPVGRRVLETGSEFQVHAYGHYVSIWAVSDSEGAAAEYARNDELDAEFRTEAHQKAYFVCNFSDLNLLKSVMRCILTGLGRSPLTSWVDTDYGWVVRGSDFLEHLKRDAGWDFRSPRREKWYTRRGLSE